MTARRILIWAAVGGLLAGVSCASRTKVHAPEPRAPADSLSQAVSLREANRHDEAARELARVIDQPVSPSLRAEAYWELYLTHRERGSADDALAALVSCATTGSSSPWLAAHVRARIGQAVLAATDGGGGWPKVERLIEPLSGSPLLLDVTASLLEAGRCRAASATLGRVGQVPESRAGEQRDLLRRISRCLEQTGRTLGLVIPLSGEYGQYGRSLQRGAALAIEDTTVLALRVEDSGSDPVNEVLAIQRLGASPDVIAAIGPLQSRAATGGAVAATYSELPLLVPLTAPTGLSELGAWVFQSAAPLQAEARAVAKYAMLQAGLTRFAVFYPSHAAGERALDAFRDQVLKLGGDVVALELYTEGRDTNFRDQIVNLKRAAPQAVFVPGEPREIVQIARQIAFYDLSCQLLGTGGWGDPEVISQGGRLVEGAVFADIVGSDRRAYAADVFAARYHDRYGDDPDHYAMVGFDLASVVWQEVSQSITSREELRRRLTQRGPFSGASGVLTWRGQETARDVQLYIISGGLAVPLHADGQ